MKVLFVCKGNVARSQMAEIFFNNLSKKHKAISAGLTGEKYSSKFLKNFPIVPSCMDEIGIDISHLKPKQLTKEMITNSDILVWMTEESPPNFVKPKKIIVWDVPNPKGESYEFHCKVRDQIKKLVEDLVKDIE